MNTEEDVAKDECARMCEGDGENGGEMGREVEAGEAVVGDG